MSISNYLETKIMDAVFNNVSPTGLPVAARFVKLHTGDPTDTGAGSPAANTTRQSVTGAATSNGVFTSVNDLVWTNVSTTEIYSFISIWDAVSAGNVLWTGALTAPVSVTAGDTFTIPAGSLTVTLD